MKSIQFTITDQDFDAIAGLEELQEIVLDCDQPPEGQGQTDEAKWGLLHFPEAMKQLTNMTHLTLSCHYGITALPQGISRLNKLEVCANLAAHAGCPVETCRASHGLLAFLKRWVNMFHMFCKQLCLLLFCSAFVASAHLWYQPTVC